MVVWNHGTRPIFIAHEIIPHPSGLSARMGEGKIIIEPSMGIDLDVLNLRTERPSDLSMLEHDLRAAQSLNDYFRKRIVELEEKLYFKKESGK